jgi:hypothetical protein
MAFDHFAQPRQSVKFQDKLIAAARNIKRAAEGRVCGDCKYLVGVECQYPWDCSFLTVTVYSSTAVACRRWERKIGHRKKRRFSKSAT